MKNKAISLTDRKNVIQRGYANHVDYYPINSRVYRGKPYANVIDDCLYCEYCLQVDDGLNTIYCSGNRKIKDIRDITTKSQKSKPE